MSLWMSIEVFDGASAAGVWADAWGDALAESAISGGALDWSWHRQTWGVILEVCFDDEEAWSRWRDSSVVQAALDAVPDPAAVIVYRGRGGSAGTKEPRRPKPLSGSGAAALPLPTDDELFHVFTGDVERRLVLAS